MSLLDKILNLFNVNKKYPKIITEDLHKVSGEAKQLEVAIYDGKTPIVNKKVTFKVNGVPYERSTNEEGIAKLNINLPVGEYDAHIWFDDPDYVFVKTFVNVTVNPIIVSSDLNMVEKDGSRFTVTLKDGNANNVVGKKVVFTVNGIDYERTTNENGSASLPINLNSGNYKILTKCFDVIKENMIHIDAPTKKSTRMEGTDINMTYKDGTKYQCAVYDDNGRVPCNVTITVNGVPYSRNTGDDGLAKLDINLNPGTYNVSSVFNGDDGHLASSVGNTIVVNKAPEPTPTPTGCTKPYTSSPHPTNSGCNGMGQNSSTYCAPSSVHKCLYKFGIRDISQATLASWMATNSSGTSHQGIETGIAKVNQVKGTNIKIQWYNKSDLSWEEIGKILCQPNKAIFCHILYKNGGTCSGSGNYGHYELLTKVNTDTGYVKVLNSLGGYCGSCYCGFYQDRTMACQEQFMRGISQKSIAVLTKQ